MRGFIKTASRFDSIWTMFVTFPAFLMLLNTGIALHQGKATGTDFKSAATTVAQTFTGQYTPYIETAGTMIAKSINKALGGMSCAGKTGGPVYLNPAMTARNGCALPAILR